MPGTDAVRACLDGCALIYRIEQRAPWAQRVNEQLALLKANRTALVVSELARLECRVCPLALGRADGLDKRALW